MQLDNFTQNHFFRIDISIRVIFHEYLPWIKRILNNMANKGYLRPILFLDLLKANCYYSASDGKKWKWWFWKIYIFHKLYVSLTRILQRFSLSFVRLYLSSELSMLTMGYRHLIFSRSRFPCCVLLALSWNKWKSKYI